jgi:TrmH family RNA methyltransferase
VNIDVVLMRPRGARNVGAIARAMKNCGVSRLQLVDSKIRNWREAHEAAVHAVDILEGAAPRATLEEALESSTWVVGTTMRELPGQRVLSPREVASEAAARGSVTLLFGDEESGLQNSELLRCHVSSRIATAPEQPSVNLAQAALIYLYELSLARDAQTTQTAPVAAASGALFARLETVLRDALIASGFADIDRPRHGVVDLIQPLRRADLTEAEARLWLAALSKMTRRPS